MTPRLRRREYCCRAVLISVSTIRLLHMPEQTGCISGRPSSDAGSFSLWGVAAALSDSVKKGTADLASSVRDTDWRAELNAFRQGVTDESQQLKVSTAAAVEQLPSRVSLLNSSSGQRWPKSGGLPSVLAVPTAAASCNFVILTNRITRGTDNIRMARFEA